MNTVQVKMALITMKTKVGNQNLLIRLFTNPWPDSIQGPIHPFWGKVSFSLNRKLTLGVRGARSGNHPGDGDHEQNPVVGCLL